MRPLLVLCLIALLTGCTAQSGPAPPTAINPSIPLTTITFGVRNAELGRYSSLVDQFNTQNPDVQVQLVSLDAVLNTTADLAVMLRQVAGTADVALVDSWVLNGAGENVTALLDLRPLIDADATFDQNDFAPGALWRHAQNGAIYAIQRELPVRLLFYNQNLWDAEGLPAPTTSWTWDDVLAAAEQLASRNGSAVERYGLLGSWGGTREAATALLLGVGGEPQPDGAAMRLEEPEVAAALSRLVELIRSGALYRHPPAGDSGISTSDFAPLIREGRVAIWSADMLSEEAAELPFAVGAAVYPPLPLADWSNTAAYAISAGTQHPEAAWRWLAFVGAQGDEIGSIPPGAITVPARPSVAEQQGYWETLERATSLPGIAAAARAAIANPPHRGASDRYSQLLTIAAAQVLDAGASPTQALAAAQQRLEERRAQAPPLADASSGDAPIVVAPPRVAAPGAAPIRFHVYEWDNPQALQALADRFHQEHPDIFVQIVIVQPQQLGNGQTTFSLPALAAGADCFPWSSPPHQSDLELLIDLQPLIDADRAFDLGDYPAAIVSRFQWNGGLYGLPSVIRFSHFLEYNPTAFDAAGLAYPRADWTIDDFLLAAQRLTQGSGEQRSYGFASIDWQPEDVLYLLDRFNARPVVGSGLSLQLRFTDPQVLAATRLYIDLLQSSSPHSRISSYRHDDSVPDTIIDLVEQGQVGMWFGALDTMGSGAELPFQRAIASRPLGAGALGYGDYSVEGLYITANAQNPAACWEWLTYLSNDVSRMDRPDAFPARLSVAQSETFLSGVPPGARELYSAHLDALLRTPPESRSPFGLLADEPEGVDAYWFFRALDRALQGADLERELEEAQFITEQFMACRQGGERWRACALAVDPEYQGYALWLASEE